MTGEGALDKSMALLLSLPAPWPSSGGVCVHALPADRESFSDLKKIVLKLFFRFYFLLDFFPLKLHFGDRAFNCESTVLRMFPK